MRRKELDRALSAIVLIVYAIVWIVNFVFNQSNFVQSEGFLRTMSIVGSVMQVLVYVVLFYNAWQVRGGLIYKILIVLVTLWLIFCVIAGYIPGLNIDSIGF